MADDIVRKVFEIEVKGTGELAAQIKAGNQNVKELTSSIQALSKEKMQLADKGDVERLKQVTAEIKLATLELQRQKAQLQLQGQEYKNIIALQKIKAAEEKAAAKEADAAAKQKASDLKDEINLLKESNRERANATTQQKEQTAQQEKQATGVAHTAEAYAQLKKEVAEVAAITSKMNNTNKASGSVGLGITGDRMSRIKQITQEAFELEKLSNRTDAQNARLHALNTAYEKMKVTQAETLAVTRSMSQEIGKQDESIKAWVLNLQKSTSEWGQLGRMVFRFAAFTLVFETITKGVEATTQAFKEWYDATHAEEEALKSLNEELQKIRIGAHVSAEVDNTVAQALGAKATNGALDPKERASAAKELQNLYPTIFGNLTTEAILAGKVGDAYERVAQMKAKQYEYETAKGQYNAALTQVDTYQNAIERSPRTEHPIQKTLAMQATNFYALNNDDFTTIEVDGKKMTITEAKNSLKDATIAANNARKEMMDAAKIGGIDTNSAKDNPKEHAYRNTQLGAQSKSADDIKINLLETQKETERAIYENQEKSYKERLQALKTYQYLELVLIDEHRKQKMKQVEAEMKSEQDLIKDANASPHQISEAKERLKTLGLQKDAIEGHYSAVSVKLLADQKESLKKETKTIIYESFADIDRALQDALTDIDTAFNAKEQGVLNGSGSAKRKADKIRTLKDLRASAKDRATISAADSKSSAINNLRSNSDYDPNIADALSDISNENAAGKGKAQDNLSGKDADLAKQRAENVKKYEELGAEAVTSATDAIIESMQKRMNYTMMAQERMISLNEKNLQSQSHSQMETMNIERQALEQKKQLDHQKAVEDRKAAETKLKINFAIALSEAMVQAIATGGLDWTKVVSVTASFLAQEAILNSAPAYADGTGNHPGGRAYLGDGGEPEAVKYGNRIGIAPAGTRMYDLPKGSEVIPFSRIEMPNYIMESNARGTNEMHSMIAANSQQIAQLTNHVQNMQITLNPEAVTAYQRQRTKINYTTMLGT